MSDGAVLSPAAAERAVPVGRLVPAAAALAAVGAAGFFAWQMWTAAITPDFHWLLRGGQLIGEQGLPDAEPFSWSAAGQPVVFYQWLFMRLLAAGDALVGLKGLLFLQVAAGVAIYLGAPLFAVPRRVPALLVLLVGGFALAIVTVNLGLRPMMATSALLLLQYMIVQAWRRGRVGFPLTAVLVAVSYAAWANLHNGVVIGLGSLALFTAGDGAERRGMYCFAPRDAETEGTPAHLGRYLLLAMTALAASLANPYGPGIYAHLLEFSSQKALAAAIVELRSPDFHIAQFRWFLLLMGLGAVALTGARRALGGADLLHLAVFTVATLLCARFVVWAALFYALILPRALHQLTTARGDLRADLRDLLLGASAAVRRYAAVALAGGAAALALWLATTPLQPDDLCRRYAPVLAADRAAFPAGGRWFAGAEIGSCSIGAAPGRRVFVDTRFDVYGEEIVTDMLRVLRLEPGWAEVLARRGIRRVVIEKGWPLAQLVKYDPKFRITYEDEVALIAVRVP
jgi:hypothetical protein